MVKDELYRWYIKIFDTNGDPKTDLVNGDFTKSIIINGVIGSNTIVVTHVADGNYKLEVTPTIIGDYLINITAPVGAVPKYFILEEYCYEFGIDDIAIETKATANKNELLVEIKKQSETRRTQES
jgi:hypothetical protein